MKSDIDFASCMETVARALLGEPNKSLSSRYEWRYGANGSLSINLKAGTWFDHETQEGGGLLAACRTETLRLNAEGDFAVVGFRLALDRTLIPV
jgi:hypothetical protein